MSIVPIDEGDKLPPDLMAVHGYYDPPRAFILHREYETLDHRKATMFVDSAKSRLNASPATPSLITFARKLATLVGDQIFGFGFGPLDCHPQEMSNALRIRTLSENIQPNNPA